MRIIKTTDPLPSDTLGQLAIYNGFDTLSLFEIAHGLLGELTPNKLSTYWFEMHLQAPLLSMAFAGLHVDPGLRLHMTQQHEQEKRVIESHLHKLCEAIGYYDYYLALARVRYSAQTGIPPDELPGSWSEWLALPIATRRQWKGLNVPALSEFQKALKEFAQPFNGNSPSQKLRLLYHFFGSPDNQICQETYYYCPPSWSRSRGISEVKSRKTNNEYGPSTDRAALEKIALRGHEDERDAAYWARPFISCCLALADYTKALGFLRCRLEQGIFRYSFGSVTETGRLNSKANAQGYGSNSQNVAPRLRVIFTCPSPLKLAANDYGQIESRWVAARCFVQFGATAYWNAVHSGDLHTLAASMVWPELAWPQEFTIEYLEKYGPFPKDMLKAAKKLASDPFYRGKSRRDVSKTLGHGTSYCGKPPQMSKHSHIEVPLIEHYQQVFFDAFPEIKQWHLWVAEQVMVHQELTTLMGRTRQFFGRPSDDATVREAVAFDPQSSTADYVNQALILLHGMQLDGFPITLRVQKHDELIFTFKETDEEWLIPEVCSVMEHPINLVSPDGREKTLIIPAEAETGWNLARKSEANPDGLGHPDASRVRVRNPFNGGLL